MCANSLALKGYVYATEGRGHVAFEQLTFCLFFFLVASYFLLATSSCLSTAC